MRQFLVLAVGLSLTAGVASAQLPGLPALPGAPKDPTAPKMATAPAFKPYEPPKPYAPPRTTSVYADGPFSPAGEAKRARKANEPPPGGVFSPEGEARRARAAAKRDAANNPF
jgi:hypothetical protein